MQVKKIIEKCCAPTLEKYGFKYLGATSSGFWEFERYEGDVRQVIFFQKNKYSKSIKIRIQAGNIRNIDMTYFINGEDTYSWKEYETEEDLKEICEKHMKAFEEKNGMQVIMDMSILVINATEDMYRRVMENSSERAEKFREEYNLNYEWDIANIKKLEEILLEKREKTNITIDGEFLLSAAAYYGELVIKNYGGEWTFEKISDDDGLSYIEKIAIDFTDEIARNPLLMIMDYYSNPFFFRHKLIPKFEELDSWIKEEMEKKNSL